MTLANSLKGVRVLDAARVLAGPFAGQSLADLGADVIKIEQPGGGDETRGWGPPFVAAPGGSLSSYFLACNRGKQSLTLDLKKPEGRALFHRLAAVSDVIIENFRGDSLAALGLDAASLHKTNPKLVVCSISGFGRTGSFKNAAGYDFVIQGLSGMMAATGAKHGPPAKVGVAIADIVTGLYATIAVLAGLRARELDGQGIAIDLALLDCATAAMANVAQSYVTTGKSPARQGNSHLQIVPYELFATADSWLILAVGNDGQWQRFCTAAEAPRLGADTNYTRNEDRVRRREVLVPVLAELLGTKTTAEWQERLAKVQVPCGPVWDMQQLFQSDLGQERQLIMTATRADGTRVDLLRSPLVDSQAAKASAKALAPPFLGEHSAAVLTRLLGLSAVEIEGLRAQKVL